MVKTKWNGEFFTNANPELTARNMGLTTSDAVAELVDNSIDAGATKISVQAYRNSDDKPALIIQDNGPGFPNSGVDGQTGEEVEDGLRYCLAHGGAISSNDIEGTLIGRFHAGLTLGVSCQSPKTEVFTRSEEDGNKFRYNKIDFTYLKGNDNKLPHTVNKDPTIHPNIANFLKWPKETGTIINLCELDNPDRKSVRRKGGLNDYLKNELSRTHRNFLISGVKIYVDDELIRPYDPLMLTPNGKWHDRIGPGKIIEDTILLINDKRGDEQRVRIKIAMMPVEKIRSNSKWNIKFMKRYDLTPERQGFSLIRNGREIASGESMGLFTKHSTLNYFKGEIHFPTELDDQFGIQVNKSRFSISQTLKDKIVTKTKPHLAWIKRETAEITKKLRAQESKTTTVRTPSEKVGIASSRFLKKKRITDEDKKRLDEKLEERKEKEIDEINNNASLNLVQRRKEIDRINKKYSFVAPFTIDYKAIKDGSFFNIERIGNSTEVILDKDHPFFDKIYDRAHDGSSANILTPLELLLFSYAHAESFYKGIEGQHTASEWYDLHRKEWSASLRVMLEQLSGFEDLDAEDAEAPSSILTIIDDATSKENLVEAIIRLEEKDGETKFTEIFKSLGEITDEKLPAWARFVVRDKLNEFCSASPDYYGDEDVFHIVKSYEEDPNAAFSSFRTLWSNNNGSRTVQNVKENFGTNSPKTKNKRLLDLVTEAMENHGGQATLKEIYSYVKSVSKKVPDTIEFNIRGRIYENSSDSSGFPFPGKGNNDIFYKVKKGVWGLRKGKKFEAVK